VFDQISGVDVSSYVRTLKEEEKEDQVEVKVRYGVDCISRLCDCMVVNEV